jgi:hypothetical protein
MLGEKGEGPSASKGLGLLEREASGLCNRRREGGYLREGEEVDLKANGWGWCGRRRFTLLSNSGYGENGGPVEAKSRSC